MVSNPGSSVGLLDDEAAIADLASSSTLCDACRAIFGAGPKPQPSFDSPSYFVHHRSGGLASAAESGCVICKQLAPAGAGRDQGPPETQDEEVTHCELGHCELWRGRGGSVPAIPNSTNEDLFMVSIFSSAGIGKLQREVRRSLSFVIAPSDKPIGTSFCPKPDPSKLAGLVRGWVESCQNQAHWQCAKYRGARRLKPRRVLEILDAAMLLREVPDKGWQNTYITLSHRWTAPEPPKLRRENASELHTTGIPLASLPQTFQDAAEICRWLGVKYLWIDSLCIYQDSKADWEREAGMMGDIYGGALINIAATDAGAACEGMIPREQRAQPLLPVISSPGNAVLPERGAVVLHPHKAFFFQVLDSMLLGRGWVHQEVCIAPATLYMTATQAWWRCGATTCSETYPDGIPLLLEPPLEMDHLSLLRPGATGEAPTNGGPGTTTIDPDQRGLYLVKWRIIAAAYSRADFTVASDRLVALAGVVSMAAGVLGSYYCGMWYQPSTTKENNHFVYQLFWTPGASGVATRSNTPGGHHPPGGRERKPIVPTWSWASRSFIDYPRINGPQRDRLAHLATPPPIGELDMFGWPPTAEDATLHLRGVLLPLFAMPHFFNRLGFQAWPRPLGDRPLPSNGRRHGVWAIFDDAQELAEVEEEVERTPGGGDEPLRGLFFLVTEYADKRFVKLHGLVLRERFLPGCDDDDDGADNGRDDDDDGSTTGRQRRRIFWRAGVFFPNQCCGYPEEDPLRDATAVFDDFQMARYGRAALEALELRPEHRALADAEATLDDIYLC